MNKEKLLEKIGKLKNKLSKHLLKTGIFAITATAPVHTAGFETNVVKDKQAPETTLSADNIYISPEAVNIAADNHPNPIYEFTNKVYDQNNREVKDFADVTKYSLWDCSYKREVGNEKNPVGVAKTFYGSLQFNRFNAENMAIYGLLDPAYKNLAAKFFVKNAGFDNAVENFKKSAKNYEKNFGDANLVYHIGSTARKSLTKYISPNFKTIFQKEGIENTQQFLNLQRAYAAAVYCSFDAKNLNKIVTTLATANIKPEQVHPAIWGMFLAKHIKGGFTGIAGLLKGKKLNQINSIAFVDAMASKYPDVFKQNSGKEAYKFAKEHYKETHSITTMKELSVILNKPEILNHYLKCLSMNQNRSISFEQAQELLFSGEPTPHLNLENSMQSVSFQQELNKVRRKSTQLAHKVRSQNVALNEIIKHKKDKSR